MASGYLSTLCNKGLCQGILPRGTIAEEAPAPPAAYFRSFLAWWGNSINTRIRIDIIAYTSTRAHRVDPNDYQNQTPNPRMIP